MPPPTSARSALRGVSISLVRDYHGPTREALLNATPSATYACSTSDCTARSAPPSQAPMGDSGPWGGTGEELSRHNLVRHRRPQAQPGPRAAMRATTSSRSKQPKPEAPGPLAEDSDGVAGLKWPGGGVQSRSDHANVGLAELPLQVHVSGGLQILLPTHAVHHAGDFMLALQKQGLTLRMVGNSGAECRHEFGRRAFRTALASWAWRKKKPELNNNRLL